MSEPFQLKVGQKYKDRRGRVWKVTKHLGDYPLCFICECESEKKRDSYTKDGCVWPPPYRIHCNSDFVELIEDVGKDGKPITMTIPQVGEVWESDGGNLVSITRGPRFRGDDVLGETDDFTFHYRYPAIGLQKEEYSLLRRITVDPSEQTMDVPKVGEVWATVNGWKYTILGFDEEGYALSVGGNIGFSYPAMDKEVHLKEKWHLVRRVAEAPPRDSVDCIMDTCGEAIAKSIEEDIFPAEKEAIDDAYAKDGVLPKIDKMTVGDVWETEDGSRWRIVDTPHFPVFRTSLGIREGGSEISRLCWSVDDLSANMDKQFRLARRIQASTSTELSEDIKNKVSEIRVGRFSDHKQFDVKGLALAFGFKFNEEEDKAPREKALFGEQKVLLDEKPLFTEAVRVGEERLCVLNSKPTKGELEEMIKKYNEGSVQAPPAVGERWLTMLGHHVEIMSAYTVAGMIRYLCGDGIIRYPLGEGSVSPDKCLLRRLQENEIPWAGEEWMHHDGKRVKISSWSGAAYAVGDSILLKGPFMGRIDGYVKWNCRWWPCTIISRTDKAISVKTFVDEWFFKVEPDGLHAQPDSTLPIAGETQGTPEEVAVKIAMGATLVSKETALKNASAVSDIPFVKDLNALHEPMTKAPHVEPQHPLKDFRFTIQRGTPKWEMPIARPEGINEAHPSEIYTMSFTITKDQPDCGDVYRSKTGMIHFVTDKAGRNYSFNGLSWVLPWHLKNQCQKIGRIPRDILDDIERRNGNDHRAIFVELSAYFGGMTSEQKSLCKMQAEETPAEAKSVLIFSLKKGDVVKLNDGRIVIVRIESNNHHSHRYRVITETGHEDIQYLYTCVSEKVGEIDEEVLEETIQRIVDNSEDDIYSDYRAAYKALKPYWEKVSPQTQEAPVDLPAKEEMTEATKEAPEIELKVGQKYKDRKERIWKVTSLCTNGWKEYGFEFICEDSRGTEGSYLRNGRYCLGNDSDMDLVKLIEDVPTAPEQPKLLLEIGKRYKDREGNIWDVTGECQEKSKKNGFAFLGRGGRHGQIHAFTKYGRLNKNRHKSKNDLVELVGESPLEVKKPSFALPSEQTPLRVGQMYKDREGKTWRVILDQRRDGSVFLCHCLDTWALNSFSYDGFFCFKKRENHKNDIIASFVSEQGERPSVKIGQVWLDRRNIAVKIVRKCNDEAKGYGYDFIGHPVGEPENTCLYTASGFFAEESDHELVSLIQEGPKAIVGKIRKVWTPEVDETLDTQADLSLYSEEAVTPSASVEDKAMSSKAPSTKQDVGVESSRFNDYLQREIEDLRAGVESRDQRIHELNDKIQDLIQQKHEQAAEFSRALFQLATREKQEQDDNVTALAMKIEALHALTATGVDCMTEELANAIERIDSQASDVATILERTAPKCPAPKEDDSLDKGLEITHRALTVIEITWKVIKFIVALSLVGGSAALTASMILGKI